MRDLEQKVETTLRELVRGDTTVKQATVKILQLALDLDSPYDVALIVNDPLVPINTSAGVIHVRLKMEPGKHNWIYVYKTISIDGGMMHYWECSECKTRQPVDASKVQIDVTPGWYPGKNTIQPPSAEGCKGKQDGNSRNEDVSEMRSRSAGQESDSEVFQLPNS